MSEQTESKSIFWKIIQFPLVRIVIAFAWLIAIYIGIESILGILPAKSTMPVSFLSLGVKTVLIYLSYIAYVRIIEKRPVSELGKTNSGAEAAFGLLVGTGLFSITIGILWVLGCYKVSGLNHWTVAIYSFTVSIFVSVFEEILFRGVLFRIIEHWIGTWIALITTAMVFGLLHLSSPGSNLVVAVMIALEAGVLLDAAYVLTRRLWFVIGIHFSWNFVQGGIFGGAVSGGNTDGILESTLTGPVLLSGGKFGAEASIVAVVVCAIAGAYMLWDAKNKENFIKPFWAFKTDNAQPQNAVDSPRRGGFSSLKIGVALSATDSAVGSNKRT